MLVLSAVFASGLPTNLPIAVVDHDGTTLSRQVVRMLDAGSDIAVTHRTPNPAEAKQALLAGEVYAVVLIPEHMERDLLLGRQPELVAFYNNQLLTVGGIVARATTRVFATFSSGAAIQALVANGDVPEIATQRVIPIPVQQSPLFNPSLDYVQFLLASLMPTVLLIFMSAGAALTLARDTQHVNGAQRLYALGGGTAQVIIGKLAPYGLAYLVAMIAGDTVGALGMTGVMTGPAFGFAGITFPRIMMNNFSLAWGALLPLTPYLQLRTDQGLRGAPVDVSLPTLGWLLAQVVVYGGILALMVRRAGRSPSEVPS